jgi:hypothetical protein
LFTLRFFNGLIVVVLACGIILGKIGIHSLYKNIKKEKEKKE